MPTASVNESPIIPISYTLPESWFEKQEILNPLLSVHN